jgi:ADP-heptose:LPS heptosyltransferase
LNLSHYGETPGGKDSLRPLLFPFYKYYPFRIWSKYRWWKNKRIKEILPELNDKDKSITVIDRLGAPGDALITSIVIRNLKKQYPRLKINCITPNPELIQFDPFIDSLNCSETFYSIDSTYWELIARKERKLNIVEYNLNKIGIEKYEYKSNFILLKEEMEWATGRLINSERPIIAICTKSKESVKNWPIDYWRNLISQLSTKYTLIQLGDDHEPTFNNVYSFAGKHTMRESAALLSQCQLFVGPDSLLMHIANGLNIKSIIIFGGSRPVDCFGYSENINLVYTPACSPCWIHDGYETCDHQVKCMNEISKESVLDAVTSLLNIPPQIHQNN